MQFWMGHIHQKEFIINRIGMSPVDNSRELKEVMC